MSPTTLAPAVRASIKARMISAIASSPAWPLEASRRRYQVKMTRGIRPGVADGAEQSSEFCTVNFAKRSTHEASFLGGDKDFPAFQ